MGTLEQIIQLKNQGLSELEITENLKEQGVSPKEINDAFNQSKIKSAISNEPENAEMQVSIMDKPPQPPKPSQLQKNIQTKEVDHDGLYIPHPQKEKLPQEQTLPQIQEREPPQIQEREPQQMQEPPGEIYNPGPPQQYPAQEFYPQEGYEEYAENEGVLNTNTILEISEQVFSEKIKKFQKQLNDTREFDALAQVKLENISSRLKRIEGSFDQLQIKILQRIGSYGKSLEVNRKEMDMMQNSFRKMVNPLASKNSIKRKPRVKKAPKKRKSKKK